MVWWLIGLIGLIVLNSVLGYLVWNLLRKNEYAEDYIADLLKFSEAAILNMREVDASGAFEADDEIGVTFRAMNEIMKDYAEVLGFEIGEEEGEHGENS